MCVCCVTVMTSLSVSRTEIGMIRSGRVVVGAVVSVISRVSSISVLTRARPLLDWAVLIRVPVVVL